MKRYAPALLLFFVALACMAATGPNEARAELALAWTTGCDSTRSVVAGDTTTYQTLDCALVVDTSYRHRTDTLVDSAVVSTWVTDSVRVVAVTMAGGRPFGPFGLMDTPTSYVYGPSPFTTSIGANYAAGVCAQIATARASGIKLNLFLAGGAHSAYKTGGKFDLTKWKQKVATYNTSAIKSCIAAGVSDGTVTGNSLLDEPENKDWGWAGSTFNTSYITKATLDGMALYAKGLFPTLPMGVNHGASGYNWRTTERFTVVDYRNFQYRWDAAGSQGKAEIYRDLALKQAAADGVAASFSLNLLAGGRPDRDGVYNCTGTDQYGIVRDLTVNTGLCRMTPARVKEWGAVFVQSASCGLLMWTYSDEYWRAAGVVDAFKSVATIAKAQAARSCRRPA